MTYVYFLIGFVLLVKGADLLVGGASSVAKRNRIPDLIIGLTIVSFGTSMPELIVNLMASFDGSSELAIGNVFGSNIANILLILGVSAIIMPLPIQRSIYFTEIPMSMVATFMVGFLANANLSLGLDKENQIRILSLSRFDGALLLSFFLLFMAYIYVVSKTKRKQDLNVGVEDDDEIDQMSTMKSIGFIVLGCVGLFIGGEWIVTSARTLAKEFGFSETFIGLTVVAVGTSLPELVTSVVAARKKKADLAVGNAIGSNIFNLLWILGASAVIRPLPFDVATNTDILMVIATCALLIVAVIVGKKPRIDRWEGFLFVAVYVAYIIYLVKRG